MNEKNTLALITARAIVADIKAKKEKPDEKSLPEELLYLKYKVANTEGLGHKKLIILACLNLAIEILSDNKIAADFQLDALNQVFWDFMG